MHGQLITSATSRISDHVARIDTGGGRERSGPTVEPTTALSPSVAAAEHKRSSPQTSERVAKYGPARRRFTDQGHVVDRPQLSVSESNLVAGRRHFDRKCETRQSAPHGYLNHAMSTDSMGEEAQETV